MNNFRTLFIVLFTISLPCWSDCFNGTDAPTQGTYVDQQSVALTATQPDVTAVARAAQTLSETVNEMNKVLAAGERLPKIEVLMPGQSIEAFDADEVIRILGNGKRSLNAALGKKKEFAGLVAYVNEFYKIPTHESLQVRVRTENGQPLTSPDSKDAAFENARRVVKNIQKVANESRLVINLTINSDPEERATYEMWPTQGQLTRTVTNNTLDGVYRGYYSYRVTKSGYKTIEGELNLVDRDGRTLDCTMNKTSDSDGPHPCKHH
jgi:hypothetical protein